MTVSVVVRSDAEADVLAAYRWYQARKLGLGDELLDEIGNTLLRIGESPKRPRVLFRGTRRARVRRFPYVVLYVVNDPNVIVLAVFHVRRSPRAFRNRARSLPT